MEKKSGESCVGRKERVAAPIKAKEGILKGS